MITKNTQQKGLLDKLSPKNLDFIGTQLQLKYSSNGRYQTKIGGLISLMITIGVAGVVYTSVRNLLSTDSPVTSISTVYSKSAPRFDLFKEEIFFHFGFKNDGKIDVVKNGMDNVNRFITLKGFILSDQINNANGLRETKYTLNIDFKPCSDVVDKKVIEYFQWHEGAREIADRFAICPELANGQDKYFVKSKDQEPPVYTLVIFVFPCSLPNASDCAPLSEFKGTELLHTNTQKAFDASNFEKPISAEIEFDGVQALDPILTKTFYYRVREVEVWDDKRDFFENSLRSRTADYFLNYRDSRTRDSSQTHCDASVLNIPYQKDCQPYFTINMESSGEKKVIVRTYPKFFMTLGEIWGTAEILILIGMVAYSKYNAHFLKKFLIEKIFDKAAILKLKRIFEPRKNSVHPELSIRKVEEVRLSEYLSPGMKANSLEFGQSDFTRDKLEERKGDSGKINQLLDQQIEENLSGISLFKSLNELKVLSRIFFKPAHKKLLPILLLKMKERENNEREKEARPTFKPAKGQPYGISSGPEQMSFRQAYFTIINKKPTSEIERVMKEFIIDHLPTHHTKEVDKNPPIGHISKIEEEGGGIQQIDDIQQQPAQEDPSKPEISRLPFKQPSVFSISPNKPRKKRKKKSLFGSRIKKKKVSYTKGAIATTPSQSRGRIPNQNQLGLFSKSPVDPFEREERGREELGFGGGGSSTEKRVMIGFGGNKYINS